MIRLAMIKWYNDSNSFSDQFSNRMIDNYKIDSKFLVDFPFTKVL
jgi:hypothetical protein